MTTVCGYDLPYPFSEVEPGKLAAWKRDLLKHAKRRRPDGEFKIVERVKEYDWGLVHSLDAVLVENG